MKKVFVVVPMDDRTEDEVAQDIIDTRLKYEMSHPQDAAEGIEFIDNWNVGHVLPDSVKNTSMWLLSKALRKMCTCDDIVFGGDWENAKHCKVLALVKEYYFK